MCVLGVQRRVWLQALGDFETKKIVLSSDVTFDEASLMKSIDSQQEECCTDHRGIPAGGE